MKKKSSGGNNSLLIKFLFKSIIMSVCSVALLSLVSSLLLLKLDVDTEYGIYISYFICAVSSFATAYIVLSDFKNNYLLVSVVAVLPLIIFSAINGIANNTPFLFLLLKITVELLFALIAAVTRIIRKRR